MLKKMTFLLFIVMIFSSFIFAQNSLKKGVYSLGGSIAFSSVSNGDDDTEINELSLLINPSLNYFVTDNLLIGASFGFMYDQEKIKDSYSSYSFTHIFRSINIGPMIRYYFNSDKLVPFIGVGASFNAFIGEEFEGRSFYGEAGFNYFLSSSAALEPFLSYTISSIGTSEKTMKDFSIGLRAHYYIIPW